MRIVSFHLPMRRVVASFILIPVLVDEFRRAYYRDLAFAEDAGCTIFARIVGPRETIGVEEGDAAMLQTTYRIK